MTRPEPLADQYFTRDLLVLHEIARCLAADPIAHVSVRDLSAAVGLDDVTTAAVAGTLRDAGFIDGIEVAEVPGIVLVTGLTPSGRREVGLWPSADAGAQRLLAALDDIVRRTPPGEQKTVWERIRDAVAAGGRDIAVGVATGVLTGQIGG